MQTKYNISLQVISGLMPINSYSIIDKELQD